MVFKRTGKSLDETLVNHHLGEIKNLGGDTMEKLLEKAKSLGWTIDEIETNRYEIGKFSPSGNDFHIVVDTDGTPESFIEDLWSIYDNFDVSYEAYLWLDNQGHGMNGAPYDMRDVYNDMEACQKNILKLHDALSTL